MREALMAEPDAEKGEETSSEDRTRKMSDSEKDRRTFEDETFLSKREKTPRTTWTPHVERVSGFEETPIEQIIRSRESSHGKILGGGVNETQFLELKDDGAVVLKLARGEREDLRVGIPAGSYCFREVAAHIVSRFLEFDLVPPTVIREYKGEIGSAQEYIPDAHLGMELTPEEADAAGEELIKLWLFDYIIWNTDRTRRNFLVRTVDGGKTEIHAIDNGLSFGKHIPLLYGMAIDTPLPRGLAESFERAFSRPEVVENVRALLEELLPEEEVDACFLRIARVQRWLEEGVIREAEGVTFRKMEREARRPFWGGKIRMEEANEFMVGYRGDEE